MSTAVTSATSPPLRMYYVDDSGANDTGWIIYSWIECDLTQWRTGLRTWIDMRKQLYVDYKIPPSAELHAVKIANGRGEKSLDPQVNESKTLGRQVVTTALSAIATSGLQIGTAYRQTTSLGRAYTREKRSLYQAFVNHLDTQLTASGQLGMIFMDGNGTDPSYNAAHRTLKLATRSIVEDPLFQQSHTSQWIQMADLAAWATYQSLLRHPGKEWSWDWYETYLRGADVNGGPIAL